MSAEKEWRWTWEHSLVVVFFALLVNACVAGTALAIESLGERVSAELEPYAPKPERDVPSARPARDPRPHVSSLNPSPGGEAMFRTKDEPMAHTERTTLRDAERLGEIDWDAEDTVPEIPAHLVAKRDTDNKEKNK